MGQGPPGVVGGFQGYESYPMSHQTGNGAEMVQFDENNPHHPAFFEATQPPTHSFFNQSEAENHPMSHMIPPSHFSGNEPRPFDQSGPTANNFGESTGHVGAFSESLKSFGESSHNQYGDNQFEPSFTSNSNQKTFGESTTSGPAPVKTEEKKPEVKTGNKTGSKFSLNNSPDSGSRCSISPRDSGYDT